MKPTLIAAAAVAALLVAGCSSSGGGSSLSLADVPLKAGDLPSSWTGKAHDASDDSDDATSQKQIVACVGGGVRDTDPDKVKEVHSKDYSSGESQITSSASLYKTSGDVTSDVALFSKGRAQSCYAAQAKSELGKELPAGASIANLSVALKPGSGGGPANVVATVEASVDLTVQGQKATAYIDSAFITGNKIEAEVDFTGFGKRIAEDTRTKAIKAIADRAAKT